jgi:hypothetical protein
MLPTYAQCALHTEQSTKDSRIIKFLTVPPRPEFNSLFDIFKTMYFHHLTLVKGKTFCPAYSYFFLCLWRLRYVQSKPYTGTEVLNTTVANAL